MPLLKPSQTSENTQVRITIDKHILAEIGEYCEFAKIKKIDEFFEQAAQRIFLKDKEWKIYKDNQ